MFVLLVVGQIQLPPNFIKFLHTETKDNSSPLPQKHDEPLPNALEDAMPLCSPGMFIILSAA